MSRDSCERCHELTHPPCAPLLVGHGRPARRVAARSAGMAPSGRNNRTGGARTTGHEPPSPGEGAITAEDVELAERRASEARERAAHAGLSAARSIAESARYHERSSKGARPDRPTRCIRHGCTSQVCNPPSPSSSRRPRSGRAITERVRSRPIARPVAPPAQLVSRTARDVARCIAAHPVQGGR
jgi:hypothetical protein